MTQMEFNLKEGRRLRDNGAAKVVLTAGQKWHSLAMGSFAAFVAFRRKATLEEWRQYWLKHGWPGPPSHHNAWGAVALAASKRGLVRKTGEYVNSKIPRNHAACIPVWEVGSHFLIASEDEVLTAGYWSAGHFHPYSDKAHNVGD